MKYQKRLFKLFLSVLFMYEKKSSPQSHTVASLQDIDAKLPHSLSSSLSGILIFQGSGENCV